MEEWRSVVGYNGLYEVSNLGRVRSLWDGRHQIHRTKVMKPVKDNKGYLHVSLWKDGEMKTFKVHRLVASAFIPNPLNKPEVNHKSEDKTLNTVDGLEWVSRIDNCNFGTRNERSAKARTNHPKISKPVQQFTKDGVFVNEYPSAMEASRQTGINKGNITSCLKGKRNSSGGSIWKYAKTKANN